MSEQRDSQQDSTDQWATTEEAALARGLVRKMGSGILSTMSQELPGYPFGSVTPYAMTHGGRVAFYVSGIAQHTANMRGEPKACLTVADRGNAGDNQQTLGRVTIIGDARPVPEAAAEEVRERYFSFFPEAREYAGAHAFEFYWIEPKRVRYIGGFGKIFWVEEADWTVPKPEWSVGEAGIISHMNSDHGDSLLNMLRAAGVKTEKATMVAADPEGFHVLADSGIVYLPFPTPCMNGEEIRAGMVQLARATAPAS